MSDPWLKFYVTDWQADPALRMCSMAARGLWIEMICLMHKATPYGHLLVNGQRPTDAQLAVLAGAAPDQVTAMLGELEAAAVFSRTREGTIYSRKLSRMAKKAATARNNGRKGGNPSLLKETENTPSDKGCVKDRDKTQKPEARSYNKEREANASPKKSASRKRTRLSGEWCLPSEWRAYAVEKGVPSSAIDREAEKFRDHHLSHGNTMADWKAAWRTWVGNFGKFGSPRLIGPSAQDEFGAFGKLKDLTNGR